MAEGGHLTPDSSDVLERKKIDEIHKTIPNDLIPKIGMEFDTEEAARTFYNSYAYKVGFSVRVSKGHKGSDGKMIDRTFCCSCEGYRGKDKRETNVKNPRAATRFGCLAKMKVNSRLTGKYRVTEFIAEHTHETAPSNSHLLRSQRKITPSQAAEVDLADSSVITPKIICELTTRQVDGRENLGFISKEYRNYLHSKRMIQMRSGDTGDMLEYLQQMQLEDPNFFYAIQVDEDDLITNIFWADAKMMIDYSYFGDVVCFDTTYRKSKEGRPFAMFVGVNHHRLSIIFGAALLYDETAESFVWLFNTFVKAMSGKKPQTILTDQDAAMAKALALVWPETCHRLCIWHLYQNALKKLSVIFGNFPDFNKDFNKCIYEYEEEEEFLAAWNNMLQKYNLTDNSWLQQMFSLKEKWALVYGRENFCADMTIMQRNESMNNAIKKYLSYKHDLSRFFYHFQRLVDDCRHEELKADFKATQTSFTLSFDVEILRHAVKIYTPTIFMMIQQEVSIAYDSSIHISSQNGDVIEYKVIPYKKQFEHIVHYDSSTGVVRCSCKRFEFVGILCSHALKVLSSRNIMQIPTVYILKRWTKHAKSGNDITPSLSITHEDPKAKLGARYKDLCRLYAQLSTKGAINEKVYHIAVNGWLRTMNEIDVCLEGRDWEADTQNVSTINRESARESEAKERFCGPSTSPNGVLEKKRKKKKTTQHDEPSLQYYDCEMSSFQSTFVFGTCNTTKESSGNMSMTEYLQSQLSSIGRIGPDAINISNSQSQGQQGHP